MKENKYKKSGFGTMAIHSGQETDLFYGALATPVYQTSTFCFENMEAVDAVFAGAEKGYVYTRGSNPTVEVLQKRIAMLEGGEACIVTSSGMGAIGSVMLGLLKSGDHLVCGDCVYGPTKSLVGNSLKELGIEATFVDTGNMQNVEDAIQENTKLIYFETPSNPSMIMTDIEAISKFAHSKGILVVVDGTFAPPPVQRPLALGADIVLHSVTKYYNGHGDVIAGAVIGNSQIIAQIKSKAVTCLCGTPLSPMSAFLVLRGIQTMELRMERHCKNAMALARLLEEHPYVERVNYPGLKSYPQHELAVRQMNEMYGGIMSFVLKDNINGLDGNTAARKLLNSLTVPSIAVSLGDPATLIEHAASMTHKRFSKEEREHMGIPDGLLRLSVGLENTEDLCADFAHALEQLQ